MTRALPLACEVDIPDIITILHRRKMRLRKNKGYVVCLKLHSPQKQGLHVLSLTPKGELLVIALHDFHTEAP